MSEDSAHLIPDDLDDIPKEERIELAILAIHNSGLNAHDGGRNLGLRKAAELFGLPRETLRNRFNGTTKSHIQASIAKRALTPAEEEVLVEWCKVMGRRGIPLTHATVRDHASDISGREIGVSWTARFMKRHPSLKIKWTTGLEACRARSLNATLVNEFYDMLEEVVKEYKIHESDIYNMDEKGIQLGVGGRVAAIVDRDQKDVYQIENGNRELVTMIETVCADGSSLRPTVIYPGKRRDLEWGRNNPCKALYDLIVTCLSLN